jgi:hypothetical protein
MVYQGVRPLVAIQLALAVNKHEDNYGGGGDNWDKKGPPFCIKQISRKEYPVELTLGDDTRLSLV